jgi:hypothetical protein
MRLTAWAAVNGPSTDAWLREGAWSGTTGDLPLNTALPIGVGIDKSPDGELGAVAIAQRQGDRVVVRAQVFAPESATGMASTEAMRARLRGLRSEYPLAQSRDEKIKRSLPGLAYAFDRYAFGESAEMLDSDGLNMVDLPMTAAVMGPPSTRA